MSEAQHQLQSATIRTALARAHARWQLAHTLRAAGKLALLVAALVASAGCGLAIAGHVSAAVAVAISGLGAIVAMLLVIWRVASRPISGTPPYALALDRAMGFGDALPALLEGAGPFAAALEARVSAAMEPRRTREAMAKPRPWALLAALVICLLPLGALFLPAGEDPAPPTVADNPASPGASPSAPPSPTPDEAKPEDAPPSTGSNGQPEPQPQAPGSDPQERPPEGAGEAPPDMPQPDLEPPPRSPQGVGDEAGPPPQPQRRPESAEPDVTDMRLLPEVGEGETRTENRARWVYNPEGARMEGAVPRAPENRAVAERAVQRQKVTTSEKRLIENLFEKLYK